MRIIVRTSRQEIVLDNVEPTSTGATLRAAVAERLEGTPAPDRVRLLYTGRIITDTQVVREMIPSEEAVIHAVVRSADTPAADGRTEAPRTAEVPINFNEAFNLNPVQLPMGNNAAQTMSFSLPLTGTPDGSNATASVFVANNNNIPIPLIQRQAAAAAQAAVEAFTSASNSNPGINGNGNGSNRTVNNNNRNYGELDPFPEQHVGSITLPPVPHHFYGNTNPYSNSNTAPSVQVHLHVSLEELEQVPLAIARMRSRFDNSDNHNNIRPPLPHRPLIELRHRHPHRSDMPYVSTGFTPFYNTDNNNNNTATTNINTSADAATTAATTTNNNATSNTRSTNNTTRTTAATNNNTTTTTTTTPTSRNPLTRIIDFLVSELQIADFMQLGSGDWYPMVRLHTPIGNFLRELLDMSPQNNATMANSARSSDNMRRRMHLANEIASTVVDYVYADGGAMRVLMSRPETAMHPLQLLKRSVYQLTLALLERFIDHPHGTDERQWVFALRADLIRVIGATLTIAEREVFRGRDIQAMLSGPLMPVILRHVSSALSARAPQLAPLAPVIGQQLARTILEWYQRYRTERSPNADEIEFLLRTVDLPSNSSSAADRTAATGNNTSTTGSPNAAAATTPNTTTTVTVALDGSADSILDEVLQTVDGDAVPTPAANTATTESGDPEEMSTSSATRGTSGSTTTSTTTAGPHNIITTVIEQQLRGAGISADDARSVERDVANVLRSVFGGNNSNNHTNQ